jgi:hypothetical protein
MVSLYADDETKLDPSITGFGGSQDAGTVGDWVVDYQSHYFGTIAQPLYVLMDHDEKAMVARKSAFDLDSQKGIRRLPQQRHRRVQQAPRHRVRQRRLPRHLQDTKQGFQKYKRHEAGNLLRAFFFVSSPCPSYYNICP